MEVNGTNSFQFDDLFLKYFFINEPSKWNLANFWKNLLVNHCKSKCFIVQTFFCLHLLCSKSSKKEQHFQLPYGGCAAHVRCKQGVKPDILQQCDYMERSIMSIALIPDFSVYVSFLYVAQLSGFLWKQMNISHPDCSQTDIAEQTKTFKILQILLLLLIFFEIMK